MASGSYSLELAKSSLESQNGRQLTVHQFRFVSNFPIPAETTASLRYCVHELSSLCDNLVFQILVYRGIVKEDDDTPDARRIFFPVHDDEKSFEKWAKGSKVPSDVIQSLKRCQPFSDESIAFMNSSKLRGHPLKLIRFFHNNDKHRYLIELVGDANSITLVVAGMPLRGMTISGSGNFHGSVVFKGATIQTSRGPVKIGYLEQRLIRNQSALKNGQTAIEIKFADADFRDDTMLYVKSDLCFKQHVPSVGGHRCQWVLQALCDFVESVVLENLAQHLGEKE